MGFGTHLTATGLAIGTSNFVTYFRVDLYICHYFYCPCCAAKETWNDVRTRSSDVVLLISGRFW